MHNRAGPTFLLKMPLKRAFKVCLGWVIYLFHFFLRGKGRFLPVTPPILASQTIYDKKNGGFIRVRLRDAVDLAVAKQIFNDNDYGFEILSRRLEIHDLYLKILSSGRAPLILDCGANIGLAARFFAETYPGARIVGVEPEQGNLNLAKENNAKDNVSFMNAAIGSADTRGHVVDPGLGSWGYRVNIDEVGSLQILSVNTILQSLDENKVVPFVIKIDIEGFEEDLFSQNLEWIDKFPILIIELHDWMLPGTASSRNFLRAISARNRDFVYYSENVFSISNAIL